MKINFEFFIFSSFNEIILKQSLLNISVSKCDTWNSSIQHDDTDMSNNPFEVCIPTCFFYDPWLCIFFVYAWNKDRMNAPLGIWRIDVCGKEAQPTTRCVNTWSFIIVAHSARIYD